MRIRCPHCKHSIEVVSGSFEDTACCPSCGSRLSFLDNTVDYGRAAIRSVGHLDLLEHVGQGQFGDVFKARDSELDRIVAVKIPRAKELDDETLQLFWREARAAAQLRHPNIVTIHEIGREEDTVYIVSDFIQGVTLSERIAQKRLEFRDAASLCVILAEAIHHAHEAGVVHRDLKPRNILIDTRDQPYITDFGLAKRDAGEITMTASGRILGTPAYMSPEQARGDGHKADRRTDVYSLGVILYELLTGKRPFQGESRLLVHQILSEEPRSPRKLDKKIPRDLETICLKAMSKEPERRYQTAESLADDLRQFRLDRPITARPVGPLERAWRSARRNPALTALSGISILTLPLLLFLGTRPHVTSNVAPEMRTVRIRTDPPGAQVSLVPRDRFSGEPLPDQIVQAEGTTPIELDLRVGRYLVVAVLPNEGFHEVFRQVPEEGLSPGGFGHNGWKEIGTLVELPVIKIPSASVTNDMAYIEGDVAFIMGDPNIPAAPPHSRFVPSFYLDTKEVTVGDFETFTGQESDGIYPQDHAARISYDRAVAYAENVGKRLPDEAEYEFAASVRGSRRFPWGMFSEPMTEWTFGPCGTPEFDRLPTEPPVFGLYSNVAEWTSSWFNFYPDLKQWQDPNKAGYERVVRGGSVSVIQGKGNDDDDWKAGVRLRVAANPSVKFPGVGLRCARSARPRVDPGNFATLVEMRE